jgi:hypothetical protein
MAADIRSAEQDHIPAHVAESYDLVAALREGEATWAADLASRILKLD